MSESLLAEYLQMEAVLFDLDGTLADSAPDLAAAGNDMRLARGLAALPLSQLRPAVGAGARGMLHAAFGLQPLDTAFDAMRDEFLRCYEARMTQQTRVFPEMLPVLDRLEERNIPWGIVTNKVSRFGEPLIRALDLHTRAATWIFGDTTSHAKPHPAPLLEAAKRMGVDATRCVYVGDDLRDVQAGVAAGMKTVAVRWGYLGWGARIEDWGAHHVIDSPAELLGLLVGMD